LKTTTHFKKLTTGNIVCSVLSHLLSKVTVTSCSFDIKIKCSMLLDDALLKFCYRSRLVFGCCF